MNIYELYIIWSILYQLSAYFTILKTITDMKFINLMLKVIEYRKFYRLNNAL